MVPGLRGRDGQRNATPAAAAPVCGRRDPGWSRPGLAPSVLGTGPVGRCCRPAGTGGYCSPGLPAPRCWPLLTAPPPRASCGAMPRRPLLPPGAEPPRPPSERAVRARCTLQEQHGGAPGAGRGGGGGGVPGARGRQAGAGGSPARRPPGGGRHGKLQQPAASGRGSGTLSSSVPACTAVSVCHPRGPCVTHRYPGYPELDRISKC